MIKGIEREWAELKKAPLLICLFLFIFVATEIVFLLIGFFVSLPSTIFLNLILGKPIALMLSVVGSSVGVIVGFPIGVGLSTEIIDWIRKKQKKGKIF